MEKARNYTLKIFKILKKPEMRILPAHLAFYLVLTIIPLVALIGTIAAALSISTDTIRQAIANSVPEEIASILNNIISSGGISLNMIVFYLSAILLASNGAYSMINASNEIYKAAPRSMLKRRVKAIFMTFIFVGLFLFLILVPVYGSNLSDIILEASGDAKIIKFLQTFLSILKYPIIFIILYINIKFIYVISPDQKIESKSTNKGALVTSLGWILSTEIFAFYIDKFTNYDMFYGSLSNMLILLLWVYLLSYIFILGMSINASSEN